MVPVDSDRISRVPPYSGSRLKINSIRIQGYHLLSPNFPIGSSLSSFIVCLSYNLLLAETNKIWALSLSLATTQEITIVFFSSGYLDVSVLRVCFSPYGGYYTFSIVGCPIRKSSDQWIFASPRCLSQLVTSFVASESQGIPHTLFLTFFVILHNKFWEFFQYVKELKFTSQTNPKVYSQMN